MTDAEQVELGRRAKIELEIADEQFGRLKAQMLATIVSSSPDQTLLREKMYLGCQVLVAVRDAMHKMVSDGDAIAAVVLAQVNLER